MGGLILTSVARRLKDGVTAQRRCSLAEPDDDRFEKFVEDNLDSPEFLARHSDVAMTGLDPMRGWLDFGIFEGPPMSRAFQARTGSMMSSGKAGGWQTSTHRRVAVAAKRSGMPNRVLDQITEQSRLDAAILAPCANTSQALLEVGISNMATGKGPCPTDLVREIPQHPHPVLPMPFPGAGGSDKFAANFVKPFQTNALAPALSMATEQSSAAAET